MRTPTVVFGVPIYTQGLCGTQALSSLRLQLQVSPNNTKQACNLKKGPQTTACFTRGPCQVPCWLREEVFLALDKRALTRSPTQLIRLKPKPPMPKEAGLPGFCKSAIAGAITAQPVVVPERISDLGCQMINV